MSIREAERVCANRLMQGCYVLTVFDHIPYRPDGTRDQYGVRHLGEQH